MPGRSVFYTTGGITGLGGLTGTNPRNDPDWNQSGGDGCDCASWRRTAAPYAGMPVDPTITGPPARTVRRRPVAEPPEGPGDIGGLLLGRGPPPGLKSKLAPDFSIPQTTPINAPGAAGRQYGECGTEHLRHRAGRCSDRLAHQSDEPAERQATTASAMCSAIMPVPPTLPLSRQRGLPSMPYSPQPAVPQTLEQAESILGAVTRNPALAAGDFAGLATGSPTRGFPSPRGIGAGIQQGFGGYGMLGGGIGSFTPGASWDSALIRHSPPAAQRTFSAVSATPFRAAAVPEPGRSICL